MQKQTLTDQNCIDEITTFVQSKPSGYAFCIAVEDKEELKVHPRTSQPCWGELRTHYKDIHKPSDLKAPFPEGTPVGLGVSFRNHSTKDSQEYMSFLLDPKKSPYRNCFGNGMKVLKDTKDLISGLLITDTKIDPTPFLNLLLNIRDGGYSFNQYRKQGASESLAYLFASQYNSYTFHGLTVLERYRDSNFVDLTTGKCQNEDKATFYDRAAYNRKEVAEVFFSKAEESVNLKKLAAELGVKTEKDYPKIFDELEKRIS